MLDQIKALGLPPEMTVCVQLIADYLDRNGWLDVGISELAREFGRTEEMMERALAVVQSLDPPGVAAHSLSECLCLQLTCRVPRDTLAIRIANEH